MTTLKDVAKKAGVSVATVSYVLNGTGSVSKKVRNKVLATVRKLGYTPNKAAQAMRTGRTRTLGLILPDLTNPFFPELAQKIQHFAHKHNFALFLIDCHNEIDSEQEGIDVLIQHNVDGLLWCPVSDTLPNNITDLSAPTVIIDRPVEGFDVVQSNHAKSGNILAEYVIKLGHRQIGLLLGPQTVAGQDQRRKGFLEKADNKLNILWEIEIPFSMQFPRKALDALENPSVSLIVAGSDVIAIGAMAILNKNKTRVPDEISVIGYDDVPWAQIVTPQLTTIKQPIADIAYQSVELLIDKIKNPNSQTRQILLDVSISERDSARKLSGTTSTRHTN